MTLFFAYFCVGERGKWLHLVILIMMIMLHYVGERDHMGSAWQPNRLYYLKKYYIHNYLLSCFSSKAGLKTGCVLFLSSLVINLFK